MILVDANLLVYAFSKSAPQHAPSLDWLDSQLESGHRVGIPWESLMAFLRLVTNPRVFASPAPIPVAWAQARRWLDHGGVWVPIATAHHADVVDELLSESDLRANDIPDVQLAAIAISHGLKLATHDAGFARFNGLKWFDPLAAH